MHKYKKYTIYHNNIQYNNNNNIIYYIMMGLMSGVDENLTIAFEKDATCRLYYYYCTILLYYYYYCYYSCD